MESALKKVKNWSRREYRGHYVVQECVDSGLAQDGGIGDGGKGMARDILEGRANRTCA